MLQAESDFAEHGLKEWILSPVMIDFDISLAKLIIVE